jgi:hypothetical protein
MIFFIEMDFFMATKSQQNKDMAKTEKVRASMLKIGKRYAKSFEKLAK